VARSAFLLLAADLAMAQLTGVWETRAPFPIAATEVSGAAIGGMVFVVCGLTPQGSTNRLFRYDPRANSWMELAPAPLSGGADHCNVAAAGGKLYLLGAIRVGSAFVDGDTWEYDPAEDRWQNVGRMNTPRGASGVAAIGTDIYVAGGLTASGSVPDFEVFDTIAKRWTRLPAMPTPRDHLTAQAVQGRIYAIAGRSSRDLTGNEEYDPVTNRWRSRAPIPTARGGLGSAAVDGRIQVFGGEGNSGTPEATFRQNEEYDPATDTWRALAPMPTPRHGLYGITIGRQVFAPAGGPRAGAFYSNVHEAFFLPPAEPPRIDTERVVNAASGEPVFAPGTLVALYGTGLAPAEQVAASWPLPEQMNGVSVRVDGRTMPLLYVGPRQINWLLPFGIPSVSSVVVSYAGRESAPATLAPNAFHGDVAPGIFVVSPEGQGAVRISGTALIAGPAGRAQYRPARRGEVIEIYCTGLGTVTNTPAAGAPALSSPLSRTVTEPIVMIGERPAVVLYSGLAPDLAGVYQVNAQISSETPAGDRVPLTVRMNGGISSNTVTIAVQ
jgi:uncharacterized protein (TIGR03437 family)